MSSALSKGRFALILTISKDRGRSRGEEMDPDVGSLQES
jgi:hypothetical protein